VLEVTLPDVDKGSGLDMLIDNLGWSRRTIVTAGDGENDLPLFKRANRSFCPDDSPAHVLEQADQAISLGEAGLFTPILAAILGR